LHSIFALTKDLKGNSDLKDGVLKASYRALWEVLPALEHVLKHFKELERQAKAGAFKDHQGIQELITLTWNKANEYYNRTDASIAWVALVALYPRFKMAYFDSA
jgi:hypothetical protein